MHFAPAKITNIITFEESEVRAVELTLPLKIELEEGGKKNIYPLFDVRERPGTAFVARVFGARSGREELRTYTCSNFRAGVLETIINDTREIIDEHRGSNTSRWWQSDAIKEEMVIPVRVDLAANGQYAVLHDHYNRGDSTKSLRLESDPWWCDKKILYLAFYTGLTTALGPIRHMAAQKFGHPAMHPVGPSVTLALSVRKRSRLMFHEELKELEKRFPHNFSYRVVLTGEGECLEDHPYTQGRIYRRVRGGTFEEGGIVDMSSLYEIIGDINEYHVRMCGGVDAYKDLLCGLASTGKTPLSIHAETW